MTAAPTWTILVPTLGERAALFTRLMDALLPQTEPYGGRVQVAAWFNNGRPSLPEIRQRMILATGTDYLCFADDDDLVAPYYVAEVMKALDQKPDYVGFEVQCYSDGAPIGIAYHSLDHKRWRNRVGIFERDISHINPIRSVIARQADFRRARAGMPEDRMWAEQLRASRALTTQVVIPRIMYHYLYSTSTVAGQGSRWRRNARITGSDVRPPVEHPNLIWSNHV